MWWWRAGLVLTEPPGHEFKAVALSSFPQHVHPFLGLTLHPAQHRLLLAPTWPRLSGWARGERPISLVTLGVSLQTNGGKRRRIITHVLAFWSRSWLCRNHTRSKSKSEKLGLGGAMESCRTIPRKCPMSKQYGPPFWHVARHEFSPVQTRPGTIGYRSGSARPV
jgi:hypothetical protein